MSPKKLGLIVNPVAGLGGRVGLKGSDGAEIQRRALELGAKPQATERACQALEMLRRLDDLEIVTCPARASGFQPTVVGSIAAGATTAQDTRDAARAMRATGVDLVLFAGGDGTARDIYEAVGLDRGQDPFGRLCHQPHNGRRVGRSLSPGPR